MYLTHQILLTVKAFKEMEDANDQLAQIKQTIESEKIVLDDYIIEQKNLIKKLNQEVTRLTAEATTLVK